MLAYWRERFPLRVFGPIAAALAVPSHLTAWSGVLPFAFDVFLAALLLAQFRLWDDLADRVSDARRHPERVLVRARRVHGYVAACAALFCAAVFMIMQRGGQQMALPMLAALTVALALACTRPRRSAATDLVRLSKYPVFVSIVAAGAPAGAPMVILAAACLSFVVACAYEVWHDTATPLRVLRRSHP